jgi:hypothetical protein
MLLSVLILGPMVQPAVAQPPLAALAKTLAFRYHEDPSRLDRMREDLEKAIQTDSQVDNLIALSWMSFLWGDIRATTREEKLEAYNRGRQIGQRAVELAPRSVPALFWHAANTARWGQVNGVVRSIFLLPTVRKEIETILSLDPAFVPVYALAGNVDLEVPGVLGGDAERAEQMLRKGLSLDPRATSIRVLLGRLLIKRGRTEEARRELQAVLDEKRPSNPADWTMKDVKGARAMLASIAGK